MSELGIVAGLRHVRRVAHAQREVWKRSRAADERSTGRWLRGAAGAAVFELLGPALVVLGAWRASSQEVSLWSLPMVLGVFVASGHRFQSAALHFSPSDVLFQPRKDCVLLRRLGAALPHLLLLGAAWSAACWLRLHVGLAERPVLLAAACAIAALAPLAWNVGALLGRLVAPGASMSLPQIVAVALIVRWALDPASWSDSWWRESVLRGLVLLIGIACAASLAFAWWQRPRVEARAIAAEFVRLPRLCVVLLLWPSVSWLVVPAVLPALVLVGAAALLCVPFALPWLLAAVRSAEAETAGGLFRPAGAPAGDTIEADDAPDPAIAARLVHRGRSPWRAAWCLYRIRNAPRWRDLLSLRHLPGSVASALVWGLSHVWGFAALAMALRRDETTAAGIAIAVGVFSRAFVALDATTLVHRWGVDWQAQARQHLLAVLGVAALPVLAFGAAVATAWGWNETRALVLATATAAFLLRAGWRGLAPAGELAQFGGLLAFAVVALLLATNWLELAHWWTVGPALALGVAAIALRIARSREADLVAARIARREREERAAAG